MGKAVPKSIKIRAEILLEKFPGSFGSDFEANKRVINELKLPFSRFDRNKIAGFITKKMNEKKKARQS
jgi:small subunit ribosomal protein S17e